MSIDNVEQNKRHDATEERLDIVEKTIENLAPVPGNITADLEDIKAENDRNIWYESPPIKMNIIN